MSSAPATLLVSARDARDRPSSRSLSHPRRTEPGREALFRVNMTGVTLTDDVDITELASMTDGYSGADIASVCRDAAMMSVRRVMAAARERGLEGEAIQRELLQNQGELAEAAVTHDDFTTAIGKVSPSVGVDDIENYAKWMENFGAS